MAAKISASADGLKVTIGNAAEDALEINQTAKTIKGINGYSLAGNGPAFRAFRNTSNSSLPSQTSSKILLNAIDFDTDNCFDLAQNRFTPNVAGYYQISGSVRAGLTLNSQSLASSIRKNGASEASGSVNLGDAFSTCTSVVSALVYLNGTTDYVELWAISSVATGANFGSALTYMTGALVRAA